MGAQSGHLFIIRGDLTRVACDAWLLPCDADLNVSTVDWLTTNQGRIASEPSPHSPTDRAWVRVTGVVPPDGFGFGASFPAVADQTDLPTPWLTNTAGCYDLDPPRHAVTAIDSFLNAASDALTGALAPRPKYDRAVPLLAIPLIGSGDGGGFDVKGTIAQAVVEHVQAFVSTTLIDVAIVLDDDASYDAAQACRTRTALRRGTTPSEIGRLWGLDARFGEAAAELARHAIDGNLVIFCGAGIGTGAGLPDWETLLRRLGEATGVAVPELGLNVDGTALTRVATRIAEVGGDAFATTLRTCLESDHTSLAHSLLASIRVGAAITTNYDRLFEIADAAARNDALAVLPYSSESTPKRWLLKWHGSIEHPDSIVLNAGEYDELDRNAGAFKDLVSSTLLIKHVLFVGYSMRDPDFASSAEAALRAIHYAATKAPDADRGIAERAFGTALQVYRPTDSPPSDDEPWMRHIRLVHPDDPRPSGSAEEVRSALAPAVRRVEITLDLIAALVGSHLSFVLDDTYEGMLDDSERSIRAGLIALLNTEPDLTSPSAAPLRDLLLRYGWSPPTADQR